MTLPASLEYGHVVGRIILAVADGSDVDRMPDAKPAEGTVTFTPKNPQIRVGAPAPVLVVTQPITCSLDESGNVVDPVGAEGVWLVTGVYTVKYALGPAVGSITHDVEVLPSHTEGDPLDLTTALPPGGPVLTASQYAELTSRIDALAVGAVSWASIPDKPAEFTPTGHAHPVTDLDTTGTADASTVLHGDGSWKVAAGGVAVHGGAIPYATTRTGGNAAAVPLVPVGARTRSSASPLGSIPTRMDLMPFTVGMDLAVTGLAVKIVTATEGGQARFALYDSTADGGPGSLLWDSGPVDASTVGVVALAASLTLPAGPLWVCGAVSGSGVQYYGWDYDALGGPDSWPPALPQPRGWAMRADTSDIITGGYPATLEGVTLARDQDSPAGAPVMYAKVTA